MREISFNELISVIENGNKNGRRYCYILGAGASYESNIPTGLDLSKRWLEEIKQFDKFDLKKHMEDLDLKQKDIEPISENYFNIYDLRFYSGYQEGYDYLEEKIEYAKPSIGYYYLARQLSETENNLIITTNFDNLIESSLYAFTSKRPIIINHELLTKYINLQSKRPILIKIHRDLFFEPINKTDEMEDLAKKWREPLKFILGNFIPIIIGYAGGDGTLMKLLEENSSNIKACYWCCLEKEEPSERVKEFLKGEKHIVRIKGFDHFMVKLGTDISYESLKNYLRQRGKDKLRQYELCFESYAKKYPKFTFYEDEKELKELSQKITENLDISNVYYDRAYIYYRKQKYKKALLDLKKALQLEPSNSDIYNLRGRAYCHLAYSKNNNKKLEYFKKALENYNKAISLDSEYDGFYSNRAILYEELQELEKALTDYNKSIKLNPKNETNYTNRASFFIKTHNYKKAINDCKKAIKLNETNASAYYNLAIAYFFQKKILLGIVNMKKGYVLMKKDNTKDYI